MRAADAQPGDVLLDAGGTTWLRNGREPWDWSTFSGMVCYYGAWKDEYGPQGELVLLVRDGQPVREVN